MYFGIDLGTTNSLITYWLNTGENTFDIRTIKNNKGQTLTPSVVYFEENNQNVIVGDTALAKYDFHHDRIIRWVKRQMGKDIVYDIDGNKYTPQMISAYILKTLKEYAEKDLQLTDENRIKKVVITVPADFDDNAKQATIDAAKIIGFEEIHLIAEPNAAVLNYIFRSQEVGVIDFDIERDEKKYFVVFDLGGGTFDVSVSEITIDDFKKLNTKVVSSFGDKYLGGINFDRDLMQYVLKKAKKLHSRFSDKIDILIENTDKFINGDKDIEEEILETLARLIKECEIGKEELSDETKRTFSFISHFGTIRVEITRDEFETVILNPYLNRIEKYINNVFDDLIKKTEIKSWNDVESIILVGGSTNIPLIKDFCHRIFGKAPIGGVDTFESVAKGAAIYSAIKNGSNIVGSYATIIPHTYGINREGKFIPILNKGDQKLEGNYKYSVPFSLDIKTPIEIVQKFHNEDGEDTYIPIEKINYSHPFIFTGDILDISLDIDDNMLLNVKVKENCVYDFLELTVDKSIKLSDEEIHDAKKRLIGSSY